MKKILFLIHDLGAGGAEKVLVNLVNNMDQTKFDITVMALFGGGVNEQFLNSSVKYKTVFNRMILGNSHLMKLFTPMQLHKLFVKEHYDVEIAYLEGPAARIVSGCCDKDTKLVSWIHCTMHSRDDLSIAYRNYEEAVQCYQKFDMSVFVAKTVEKAFCAVCPDVKNPVVLYNTNESSKIQELSKEPLETAVIDKSVFNWCGIGKIVPNKGFDRMLNVQKSLVSEGYNVHFHAIGSGPKEEELKQWCHENKLEDSVSFWGYQKNPYKFLSQCDLYVCASHAEGFSTAATEALIVGTPVCTVEVSGMKEMLGENNEYGIVTDNDEKALYKGIKSLLDNPLLWQYYKNKAEERGKTFSTENTVKAVEDALMKVLEN